MGIVMLSQFISEIIMCNNYYDCGLFVNCLCWCGFPLTYYELSDELNVRVNILCLHCCVRVWSYLSVCVFACVRVFACVHLKNCPSLQKITEICVNMRAYILASHSASELFLPYQLVYIISAFPKPDWWSLCEAINLFVFIHWASYLYQIFAGNWDDLPAWWDLNCSTQNTCAVVQRVYVKFYLKCSHSQFNGIIFILQVTFHSVVLYEPAIHMLSVHLSMVPGYHKHRN